jgi:hypothetical protein
VVGLFLEELMPITVKLSERFYQKFGHELVNELVDWFNDRRKSFRARWMWPTGAICGR